MELIKPGLKIDFVGKRKIAAVVSFVLVVCSLLAYVFIGPSWGIDFTGGTEVHVKFREATTIGDVRDALAKMELGGDAVQSYGGADDNEFVIRIQDPTFGTADLRGDVEGALRQAFGQDWISETSFDAEVGARLTVRYAGPPVSLRQVEGAVANIEGAQVQEALDENTIYVKLPGVASQVAETLTSVLPDKPFDVLQVDSVGPKVGGELRTQGIVSILATLALILVYVGFRFDLTFAPGAVVALFHDVTVAVGVLIVLEELGLSHNEFNLPMVGALLTIVGYSLNDTIIIYDRIRENMARYRRGDTEALINTAINETLGRTLATTGTTVVALLAFLVLGTPLIKTFALTIIIGIVLGSYSTIYVASPMILVMEDVRPYLMKLIGPFASGDAVKDGEVADPALAGVAGASGPAASAANERRKHREAQRARRGSNADQPPEDT
jgi:preprotein translocase subunit SecF